MQTLRRQASLPLNGDGLCPARLRSIAPCVVVRVPQGEVLIREGDEHQSWHLVHSGAVALSCTSSSGHRSILAVLGPGDLLPPPFLDRQLPRRGPPEARALIASTVHVIPSSVLDRLVRIDGAVAAWVCSRLRRHADRFQEALEGTLGLRVRERVLRALFDLARTHGHASPQGVRIRIPLPQETVAWMVGATRESVNRTLRTLEADGSIRRSGGRYVLLASATHGVEGGSP
jgi:CRP-like cAMP-binding protein